MANYYAMARSNYFRVKDADEFKRWCKHRNLDFSTKEFDDVGARYTIFPGEGEEAGWPRFESSDGDDDIEIDIPEELSNHLHPKDAAVLFQVGWEKLRYLTGDAVAVTSTGKRVYLTLDEIYDRAEKLLDDGMNITEAAY
jgi:hypothetical protein